MILEESEYIRPTYLPIQVSGQALGYDNSMPVSAPESESTDAPLMVSSTAASWRPTQSGRMIPVLELPKQGTSLEEVERELVGLALKQTAGNQTHAAKLLDISRDALRYKMKKFGFDAEAES